MPGFPGKKGDQVSHQSVHFNQAFSLLTLHSSLIGFLSVAVCCTKGDRGPPGLDGSKGDRGEPGLRGEKVSNQEMMMMMMVLHENTSIICVNATLNFGIYLHYLSLFSIFQGVSRLRRVCCWT